MTGWKAAAAAAVLLALGVVLPAREVAAALAGSGSPVLARVITGVWLFKGLLVWHAVALWALSGTTPAAGPYEPPAGTGWRQAPPASPRERALLIGLLAVGAALRFRDLGDGLWYDEIRTLVGYVRLPVGLILTTFDSQNQHPLYSLLARGAFALLGESAWALRLPAALLGVASLWALYWFGCRVTSRHEALLGTAFLTFSYHHVWFSQNARGYTSLLLFSLLGSGLFIRLLTRREQRGWGVALAYAAAMALAVYTHVTAACIVAAHFTIWVWLLWQARRGSGAHGAVAWAPVAAFILAVTLSLQLYAIVLPQFVNTITTPTMAGVAIEWKSPLWLLGETARGLSEGLLGGWPVLATGAVVGLAGVVSYARRSPPVAAAMLLPAVFTGAAAVLLAHNLWPRLFFFAAGFAVLIVVRGLFTLAEGLRLPQAQVFATAGITVLLLAGSATLARAWRPKQDYVGAKEYVERMRGPDDAVVTVDLSRYPYQAYLPAAWYAVDNVNDLLKVERDHRKTWVLYTFPQRLAAVQPDVWARLQQVYRRAAEFPGTVGGGAIVVMVRG